MKNRTVALRLAFELLVVFVGVWGAFVAEDYREKREQWARARQFYQAIAQELDTFIGPGEKVAAEMTRRLEEHRAQRKHGLLPAPAFCREPRAERPPTAVWDATLASGGVTVIDPALFYELANLYNRIRSIADKYQRYNAFTENEIMPRLGAPPEIFYLPGAGELEPRYVGHMQRLSELRDDLRVAIGDAQAIRAAVAQQLR